MAPTKNNKDLRHDIADCLNPIAVSIGYLDKLVAAGRNEEALKLIHDVLQPAMDRARTTLAHYADEESAADGRKRSI